MGCSSSKDITPLARCPKCRSLVDNATNAGGTSRMCRACASAATARASRANATVHDDALTVIVCPHSRPSAPPRASPQRNYTPPNGFAPVRDVPFGGSIVAGIGGPERRCDDAPYNSRSTTHVHFQEWPSKPKRATRPALTPAWREHINQKMDETLLRMSSSTYNASGANPQP
uniref:Uncharacterized protein n=1 Tax=Neobodo designis TaxID=312471 RepID=A0A7S1QUR7_NEODS